MNSCELEPSCQSGGRLAHWEAPNDTQVEYIHGAAYDELRFGHQSHTFTANSVLLIPNLLSEAECELLLTASEDKAEDISKTEAAKLRMSVLDHTRESKGDVHGGLGLHCTALWETVLNERLIPFLQTQLPDVFGELLAGAAGVEYAGSEPSVNRYLTGGEFRSHTDDEAVTVNCLLRKGGFLGGGTEFWEDDGSSGLFNDDQCTVRLHPEPGVGVLFHGDVWHAGAPVTEGVRYLLVASFTPSAAP